MAVWPPLTHADVDVELDNAHGWAPSTTGNALLQRLRIGEQFMRADGPLWVPGRFVSGVITCTTLTTQAATADRLYLIPVYFARPRAVDQLAVNVSTLLAGNVRMGLWNSDPDTSLPTTVLVDGGTPVSTASTGVKTQTISATAHGLVWFGLTCSSAATFSAFAANESPPIAGSVTASNAPANHIYTTHSQANAMPNLTAVTPTYATANVPAVMLRAA